MRRREFIAAIGGAVAARPLRAVAQAGWKEIHDRPIQRRHQARAERSGLGCFHRCFA